MKKATIVSLSVALILASCVIYSCSKQNNSVKPLGATASFASADSIADTTLERYVSTIALLHNTAVANLYTTLSSICPQGIQNVQQCDSVVVNINRGVLTFIDNNLGGSANEAYNGYPLDAATPGLGWQSNTTSMSAELSIMMKQIFGAPSLSQTLYNAINSYQLIVENNTDNATIASQANTLVNNTLSSLPNTTEKMILLAMVDIGNQSLSYWTPSVLGQWDILDNGGTTTMASVRRVTPALSERPNLGLIAKDMVFSDCLGAMSGVISGGIAGATVGTFTLPGIGTVVGGVGCGLVGLASGGVSASVTAGVYDAIKWFIGWGD